MPPFLADAFLREERLFGAMVPTTRKTYGCGTTASSIYHREENTLQTHIGPTPLQRRQTLRANSDSLQHQDIHTPLKKCTKNGTSSRFRNFFRRTLILDDHIRNATHSTSPPPPRYPFKHWVSTPLTPAHPISPQPLPNRNTAFPSTIDPNHTDLHHRTATHIQTTPIWALGDAHKFEPIGNDTQMQTNASTWDPWGRTTQRPHATTNGTRQTGTAPFNNSAPLATTLHSGASGRLLTTKRNPLDLATCDAPQRMHGHGQK